MFTKKEYDCIVRALSLISRLLTSPFAFNEVSFFQEAPRYKLQLKTLLFGFVFFELLAILLTLHARLQTENILNILAHGFYTLVRVGYFLHHANLVFYGHEVQELISQTLMMNAGFGSRLLGRKEVENKRREGFLVVLLTCSIVFVAFFQMLPLLTFWNIPITAYPGLETLSRSLWFLTLLAAALAKLGIFLEEVGAVGLTIIGFFCVTSNSFWLKKAW
jgi:hypothetical protein